MKNASVLSKSGVPLYYQLENLLRQKILSGELAPGEKIATENELSEQYQISRITVRQALSRLVHDGLIERRQGSGTFVSHTLPFQGTTFLTGSLQDLMTMGQETEVKLLESSVVVAGPKEARQLALNAGQDIFQVKRIRFFQNKPYSLVVASLPLAIGNVLTPDDLSHGSLLKAIETRHHLSLVEAFQIITAELADGWSASLLQVAVGAPLLSIERTVYSHRKNPVAFVHTLYRSDIYRYAVKLVRDEGASSRQWSVE